MPRLHTASALYTGYQARYPQPGVVDLSASGEGTIATPEDFVPSLQAAGVHSFSAPGRMQYVKALDHFLVLSETIQAGEYVQLPESDAKYLVGLGRAEFASDADVAAAQKAGK